MKNQFAQMVGYTVVIIVVLLAAFVRSKPDGLLHVVFCDVGQGDAIYIKTPDGKDILIDGGPDNNVLNCLGDHMAFWDRKIELMVLTHPQYDHFKGLTEVVKRYKVDLLLAPPPDNEAKSYQEFKNIVVKRNVDFRNIYAGESISLYQSGGKTEAYLSIVWPGYDWVTDNVAVSTPEYELIDKKVLGVTTTYSDLNDFSIVANLNYKFFDVLLTGDAESKILEDLIQNEKVLSNDIEVYKIGHHGAREGLSQSIIDYIKPDLAIISVGENNRYGHPRKEVLDILNSSNIPVKRTDLDGEIEVVSDGESWWVE